MVTYSNKVNATIAFITSYTSYLTIKLHLILTVCMVADLFNSV